MGQQEIENLNKWHLSKYNIFSTEETEDKKLPCVNLFKGTYSELDIEDIGRLYHLEEIENIEKELQGFIKQGIIVNFDELGLLRFKTLTEFMNGNIINITIVTTMKCNFNCPYCFEKHNGDKMNLELQDKTFELLKNMLKACNSKKLHITWYGGEPLLATDVIENLSKKIIEYTEEKKIYYSASIVTNGYLLNQEKINILEKYKVEDIQVTLDGLKEHHDKTRCLINGTPTFDKIINNLYNIKFSGRINVRYNTHKENLKDKEELEKLILDIKLKTKNKIKCYQAVVIDTAPEIRENQVTYLNNSIVSKIEADRYAERIFSCKAFYCSAQKLWSVVVGSDGNLYKCWEDVWDEKRSFGKVGYWNPYNTINNTTNLDSLLTYISSIGIFNNEECINCAWLPLCAGGCPTKKIYHNIKCLPFKDNPNYFIQKVKEYKIKRMTSVK